MSDEAGASSAPEMNSAPMPSATDDGSNLGPQAGDEALFQEAVKIAAPKRAPEETPAEAPVAAKPEAKEAPKEAPKEEAAEPKASAWAKLHARDKELTQRELKFKEEMKSVQGELEAFKKTARTDKIAALKMLGYEDPIKFLEEIAQTDGHTDPKMSQIEMELKALRDEREAEKKAIQQQREAEEQRAAVDKVNQEIVSFLKNDPKYSKGLVSHPEGKQAIFDVMQSHYHKTGELLPMQEAAAQVEKNWEAGLLSFADHPRGRELLLKVLNKSEIPPGGASQKSSPVSRVTTQKEPQAQPADFSADGEKELAEATRWLRQRAQARREA